MIHLLNAWEIHIHIHIYIYYLHLYGDLKHPGDISNEWEYLSNKQAVEITLIDNISLTKYLIDCG